MIRVLVIDDHPAMRAGLEAALSGTPDLVAVGAGAGEHELWQLVKRTAPDVVLLDYHLPGRDGLELCQRLKNTTLPPAVIIYSAYADTSLSIAAAVAGADGIVKKAAPARELFEVIRQVSAGDVVLPELPATAIAGASKKLDDEDKPLLAILLDRGTMADAATALRLPLDQAAARTQRIIRRLRVSVPSG